MSRHEAQPPVADLPAPRRVLIIKPSSLGDVVSAMPILRGLRRTSPQAHVAWLVVGGCSPLIRHDTDLNETILFDRRRLGAAWRSLGAMRDLRRLVRTLRAGQFDWVIDAQGLLRSGLLARCSGARVRAGFACPRERAAAMFYTHRVETSGQHTVQRNVELARGLGLDASVADMTLQVSQAGTQYAADFRRRMDLGRGDYIVAVPPTRWGTKLYPVRHWQMVLRALSQRVAVAMVGASDERDITGAIMGALSGHTVVDLAGQTRVDELVGLIAHSRGVICSDSAAQYIAPAVGVRCLSLLGPTRVERTGPVGSSEALVAPVACQGCLKRRCRHVTCMQSIDPRDVIAAAERMFLEGPSAAPEAGK
jgi:lipopolysaccharide heptosyltransferase I